MKVVETLKTTVESVGQEKGVRGALKRSAISALAGVAWAEMIFAGVVIGKNLVLDALINNLPIGSFAEGFYAMHSIPLFSGLFLGSISYYCAITARSLLFRKNEI